MKNFILASILCIFFIGCGPKTLYEFDVTNQDIYKPFYDENPVSILILPAVDHTTAAQASELFSYTIAQSLAQRGFYVFAPSLVDEFFKSENITDPTMVRQIPIEKIKEVFNPDAILYANITKWDTNYKVLSSDVTIVVSDAIISAKTDKMLYATTSYASSASKANLDASSPIALLVSGVVSAVSAAINTGVDYQSLAKKGNYLAFYDMPLGKYHVDANEYKKQKFATIKILDFNLVEFQKQRAKDPNAKLFVRPINADEDNRIVKLVEVKTDENGNIVEQNGKPIVNFYYYSEPFKK